MCKSKRFKFIVQTWKGYDFAARFLMREHTGVIYACATMQNDKDTKQNQNSPHCFLANPLRRSLDPRHYTSRPSFQMSDVESRMSDVGRRMSADVGCQIWDVGCRMSDVECRMPYLGCRMSDVKSRMSNLGCPMSDLGCWMSDGTYKLPYYPGMLSH